MHATTRDGYKIPCCSIFHHNTAFFGLAKNDHRLLAGGKCKKDWAWPSDNEMDVHAKELKRVLQPDVVQLQETTVPSERPTVAGGAIV